MTSSPQRPRRGGGRVIGLLGGSFNPAHQGHLRLSAFARQTLTLDEVWWLVSPQNPLKSTEGMAPFEARLRTARAVAAPPYVRVSDIEARLGTRYTVDTLAALLQRYPQDRFVWLMGADNLIQVNRWHRWRLLFDLVPVAVVDRPGYTYAALASRAATALSSCRRKRAFGRLAQQEPPAWAFVFGFRDWTSSTALRRERPGGLMVEG